MHVVMTVPRFTASAAGARLSELISDATPSVQRSALALFGFIMPCALALALGVGHATGRPLVLASAAALAIGQIAYLRYGSPGPRGWRLIAVAVPLTLAVTTLSMSAEANVMFPLLFMSVCWSALSLRGPHVIANVARHDRGERAAADRVLGRLGAGQPGRGRRTAARVHGGVRPRRRRRLPSGRSAPRWLARVQKRRARTRTAASRSPRRSSARCRTGS